MKFLRTLGIAVALSLVSLIAVSGAWLKWQVDKSQRGFEEQQRYEQTHAGCDERTIRLASESPNMKTEALESQLHSNPNCALYIAEYVTVFQSDAADHKCAVDARWDGQHWVEVGHEKDGEWQSVWVYNEGCPLDVFIKKHEDLMKKISAERNATK